MPEFCEFIESELSVSLNGVRPHVQDKIKTSTNMPRRRLLKFGAFVFLLLPMQHVVCLLSNAAAFITINDLTLWFLKKARRNQGILFD